MQISDEYKKKLQKEFFEELLPKWDIENDFIQLGKKYLMNGEYIIAKNIFDDVLFVNPDHEIARVYKQFAALVLAGEKSQEQLEILNKLLLDVDYLLQKKEYREILEIGDILNDKAKKFSEFYKLQNKIIEAKLNLTFDEFCTAYDHKKWDKVIELGEELDNLGASEEVYPRKEKLRIASENLRSDDAKRSIQEFLPENFKVLFKGRELKAPSYSYIENGVELQDWIPGPGILNVISGDIKVKIRLTEKDVFLSQLEPQYAIPFEQIKPTIDKTKKELNIKIYPGRTKARVVLTILR